jgi:hypothetical protein
MYLEMTGIQIKRADFASDVGRRRWSRKGSGCRFIEIVSA